MSQTLNQILTVEKYVKGRDFKALTNYYKVSQKPALFDGFTRKFYPLDEESDVAVYARSRDERQLVQQTVPDLIKAVIDTATTCYDVTASKDMANTIALADVVVDGEIILTMVPATFLLFLEKQLKDIQTFVGSLPVLDSAKEWIYDDVAEVWKTNVQLSRTTHKVPEKMILAEATEHHPAQVKFYEKEVANGRFEKVYHSGAISKKQKAIYVAKVEKLHKAVKVARVQANGVKTEGRKVGDKIFSWLFN